MLHFELETAIRKNHKSKNVKIAADEIYNEFYQAYIETQKLKKRADDAQHEEWCLKTRE